MELFALASLALVAGVVSFTAPCTLPLLPGYVSYVSGLTPERASQRPGRRRVLTGALLFVAGFTIVFTAMGATASALGWFLARNTVWLNRVAGLFIVVMALAFVGVVRLPWLQRERRADLSRFARGPGAAAPMGAAFALAGHRASDRCWRGSSPPPRSRRPSREAPSCCSSTRSA